MNRLRCTVAAFACAFTVAANACAQDDIPKEITTPDHVQSERWFVILRLYSPLESFFDKSWRPSEIELVE